MLSSGQIAAVISQLYLERADKNSPLVIPFVVMAYLAQIPHELEQSSQQELSVLNAAFDEVGAEHSLEIAELHRVRAFFVTEMVDLSAIHVTDFTAIDAVIETLQF